MESEGEGEEAPTQAAAAEEGGGDEADLLALLQRLGLALSPSSSSSKGDNNVQGSSRGDGAGDGDGGSSLMPRASKPAVPPPPTMATATTAPAPTNGSQAAPGVSAGKKVPGSAGAAEWAPWQSTHIQQKQQVEQQQQKQVPSAGKRVNNQPPRRSGRRNGAGHCHSGHERSQSDGGVRPANRYPHRCGGGIGGSSSLDKDDPSQRVGMQVGTAAAAAAVTPENARQSGTSNGGASSPSAAAVGGGGVSTSPAQARGGSAIAVSKNEGGGLGMAAAAATATEDGMVDLMRREITAREALLLGPILWAATGVTCLKLCYNHLRDGGAEAVSGAIERHPSLHTMDLGKKGGGRGGQALLPPPVLW